MTRIAIVGGGINGLVAANYLARGGADVTLHERRAHVGGACVSEAVTVDGIDYEFPLGATVLGLMQDFVLEETGLSSRLETWAPPHPKLVHFPGVPEPVYIHRDPQALEQELRDKCGEQGNVADFRSDEACVVAFLRDGYRAARAPSLEDARRDLGEELTERFIEGSARAPRSLLHFGSHQVVYGDDRHRERSGIAGRAVVGFQRAAPRFGLALLHRSG